MTTTLRKPIPHRTAKRSTRVKDQHYREWILEQESVVAATMLIGVSNREWDLFSRERGRMPYDGTLVEGHHHTRSDYDMLPLLACLHRETCLSVRAGGGRSKFERRFLTPFGKSWASLIAEHNERYEREMGRRIQR